MSNGERITHLEVEVGRLSTANEQGRREMQELFAAMNARFDQLLEQRQMEHGENSVGQLGVKKQSSGLHSVVPKLTKLEFL